MDFQGRRFGAYRTAFAGKRGRVFYAAIRVEPRVYSRPYAIGIETGVFCVL